MTRYAPQHWAIVCVSYDSLYVKDPAYFAGHQAVIATDVQNCFILEYASREYSKPVVFYKWPL